MALGIVSAGRCPKVTQIHRGGHKSVIRSPRIGDGYAANAIRQLGEGVALQVFAFISGEQPVPSLAVHRKVANHVMLFADISLRAMHGLEVGETRDGFASEAGIGVGAEKGSGGFRSGPY